MPSGYVWQYHLILWMQTYEAPWLTHLVQILAQYGMEGVYLLVLPVIFWSVHRRFGLRLGYVLLVSMYVNNWLKIVLSVVRPTGVPGIRTIAEATGPGYSLPSAHAQEALTFFGVIAMALRRFRGALWMGAFLIAAVIGVSRIYAGLHWPVDVLLGLALGAVFSTLGWLVAKWWTYRNYSFSVRATIGVLFGVVLVALHRGAVSAEYAAWILGGTVGLLLEEYYVGCDLLPELWRRVCTAVIGMAGLVALQWVIQWPTEELWWLVARGVLVGAWCTLGAPYVFVQCGLYHRAGRSRTVH